MRQDRQVFAIQIKVFRRNRVSDSSFEKLLLLMVKKQPE